jgi:diguanylate cyclase (GGDEF)-like protein
MTKKITKSLIKLTKSAELLAYDIHKIDFEINTDDEIGILAKTLSNAAKEIAKSNIQINKLAYFDSLTDIKNRHCFNRFVTNLNGLIQQNVGAIFCDLNGLKYTNDNFGHNAGDKMICEFAEILKTVFANYEVFRLSGDEFIIFSIGNTKENFYEDISKLQKLNEEKEFPYASLGFVWRESSDNLESLLKLAEAGMYQHKKQIYEKFPQYRR